MVSKVVLQAIVALVLVSLSTASQGSNSHAGILNRASRILQTSSQSIVASPDVKTNCDDKGVLATDITLTLAQRDQEKANQPSKYQSLIDAINSDGAKNPSGLVNKAVGGALGVSIVFAVLTFLSLVFLFFWSLFECCCKKTCCMKPEVANQPRSKPRIVCWILGALVAIATVGVTIGWVVALGKVGGSIKDFKCGLTILYSDIIKGAELEGGAQFVGTDGLSTIITQYISFMDQIPGIKSDANTIKSQNLETKSATMSNNYNSFSSSFDPLIYNYKGSKTASTVVTPVTATSIKASISASVLSGEVTLLKTSASNIAKAADQIASYDDSTLTSGKQNLQSLQTTLNTSLADPLTKYYTSIAGKDSPDYSTQISNAMRTFMIVSIIVIVLFAVIYLVLIFFMAWKGKLLKLKPIIKVVMLLQTVLGLAILIFAIFGSIISILIVVLCAAIDGAITTPGYFSKISSDAKISDLMTACVSRNGDGDLLKALGADLTNIDKFADVNTGLNSYSDIKANLSQTNPLVGGSFGDNLTSFIAYTAADRGSPQTEDVQSGVDLANSNACALDTVNLIKPASCGLQSTPSDTINIGKGVSYCFTFGGLPALTSYVSRYSSATSNTCAGSTVANGELQLTSIVNSIRDYKAKIISLSTNYNTNFYTSEKALFTAIKTSSAQLDRISVKFADISASLTSLNGGLSAAANCLVVRKEFIILENVVCFRIGRNFYNMNDLAVAVGCMLFFYSWCICCGMRLANEQTNNPNAVGPQGFSKVGEKSALGSPVNDNPKAAPMIGNSPPAPAKYGTSSPVVDYK